jgi:hypothetical protein
MRGYHRPIPDLKSFATPSKTREETAEHIAAGYPSPVSYEAHRLVEGPSGLIHEIPAPELLPVNLRPSPAAKP